MPHAFTRLTWLNLALLLALAAGLWAGAAASARAEEELVTEPLSSFEETPTPVTRRMPSRTRAASGAQSSSNVFGRELRPRSYGGKTAARSGPSNPPPIREVELDTEPLAGSESEDENEPQPTPTPARRRASKEARHFSYSPSVSSGAPAAGELPGMTDPELLGAEPLAGRELKTEPLADDEATRDGGAQSEALNFRAEIDRNIVHLDESFTLTVEVTAPDLKECSSVRFNPPRDFDLINTHHAESRSNAGGRMLLFRTQNYVFLPLSTGAFTLPAAEVTYRGRVYKTAPLELTVEGPRSGFAYQRQFSGKKGRQPKVMAAAPDTFAAGNENRATFFANLDPRAAYVNQQVTLTVRLRYQHEFGQKVIYTPPPLTGFLTDALQQNQTEALVSGTRQKQLERVYRTALFPIQAGTLTLGSAQVVFSKWGQIQELSTEPLALEVKPLPPDPELKSDETPTGLVGRYQLTADLLPGKAEVEVPLRLLLVLKGEGNIRAAQEPGVTTDPSLRLQLEDKGERITRDNGIFQGERSFQYVLVPRKPGRLALGRAAVRYFDPRTQAWQTAAADLPTVEIRPQPEQEAVKIPGGGKAELPDRPTLQLRPIHGGPDVLRQLDRCVAATWRFWLLQALGLALVVVALLVRRWQQQALTDPRAARARRAHSVARQALQEAHGHMRKNQVSSFYDCIARAATEYLAAKFNVPASYIVSERLNEYFDRHQVPNVYRSRFKITLTACEYVRFAAVELPTHDMRSLHRDLGHAIDEFERYWRKAAGGRKGSGMGTAVMLLLGLVLLAGMARAGEQELFFLRGNSAFEQGQYATALSAYQKVIALGIADPDVYYNLGNTYLKLGQLGRAVLVYEKGLRLAPRDADLRHNLAEAATLAVDAQPEEAAGGLWGRLFGLYDMWTANELAWAASACYFLLVLSIVGLLLLPARGSLLKRLVFAAAALLTLTASWSAARYFESRWRHRAVVLTSAVEILGRPYRQAETLYTVHEGTRVTVAREEEEWVEVRFGEGRHGWCPRGALGMIQ